MRYNNRGFSLMEVMIVFIILGIIAVWAIFNFQDYSKRANLIAAKSAMLENANYLENFYSRYYRYNEGDPSLGEHCNWPKLPKTEVAYFNIAFSTSAPSGCQTESYIMYATPNEDYQKREKHYLRMDEHKNIVLCVAATGEKGSRQSDKCEVFK